MSIPLREMKSKNPTLGLNPAIELSMDYPDVDVFIAGASPIGATYAKICVEAGLRVLMIELGPAARFAPYISADGTEVLVPESHKRNEGAADPRWDPLHHLGEPGITVGVGGMSSVWSCMTPRMHPIVERPVLSVDAAQNSREWEDLYARAETLLGTSTSTFDRSIRHTLVLRTLQAAFPSVGASGEADATVPRVFVPLPVAAERVAGSEEIHWHATDRILADIFTAPEKRARFTLLTEHRLTRLALDGRDAGNSDHVKIAAAEVRDMRIGRDSYIQAKVYVVAGGTVATPQVLYNSGFAGLSEEDRASSLIPNLGKYMTEQAMALCQVALRAELVESIRYNPFKLDWWSDKVERHSTSFPDDPILVPKSDPDPQVTMELTEARPWHTQIHRDPYPNFAPGSEGIDSRLLLDLRYFGYATPRETNMLTVNPDLPDSYGMPKHILTFEFSEEDKRRNDTMLADLGRVASFVGSYVPGAEPQVIGKHIHLAGTTRVGLERSTTVADVTSRVWAFDNLYVAGNGVIPTGFTVNPTLTSVVYALKSAEAIVARMRDAH